MEVVRRRLEAAGWRVEDTSHGNPFDLACAKDGREIKLDRPVEADPVASGGRVLWFEPWRIDDGALTPTNYRWRPGSVG
jgi:hypothetical protein